MRSIIALLGLAVSSGTLPPVQFVDLATPFERAAMTTMGQPESVRVAEVRRTLDPLLPGVYAPGAATDRRIARALANFPATRTSYDAAIRAFPAALSGAVSRFRAQFPDFVPPLQIYLYHSLGTRDGGSDYVEPGHRLVMFFGADVIAALHADNSLEPFLDHELFHLEHARHFPDCDQFWCLLWQEGLAVDAAATMTPGATDRQLLLDAPVPMRAPTDQHWREALCFVARHFDDTESATIEQAFQLGGQPPSGLPKRFGYYLGLRIAQATGRSIQQLDRLDHQATRPLVRRTLMRLLADAKATCAAPSVNASITHLVSQPA